MEDDDGNQKYEIPTAGTIADILDVSDTYVDAFDGIYGVIQAKKDDYPEELESLEAIVTKEAIQDIRDYLGVLRQMPYGE